MIYSFPPNVHKQTWWLLVLSIRYCWTLIRCLMFIITWFEGNIAKLSVQVDGWKWRKRDEEMMMMMTLSMIKDDRKSLHWPVEYCVYEWMSCWCCSSSSTLTYCNSLEKLIATHLKDETRNIFISFERIKKQNTTRRRALLQKFHRKERYKKPLLIRLKLVPVQHLLSS